MNNTSLAIKEINESFSLQLNENMTIEELRRILTPVINEYIQDNFQKLVTILYRVDVSENRLKQLLREDEGRDAASIIADLLIEREIQKIKTREQFKQPGDNIPGEENW